MSKIVQKTYTRKGFTLIEMMVVVAIIGLLLAALLPAFSTARNKAKNAQANAIFKALDTGIVSYQAESALGGTLPPSSSDNPKNRQLIINPKSKNGGVSEIRIAGAHLLAMAMVGADGLGTAGFKDLNRDGRWWNDTHDNPNGLYELDVTTLDTKYPRYGGAGYVDDKIRSNMKSLQEMEDAGIIQNLSEVSQDIAKDEQMFLDPWGMPILYYKANRSSQRMIAADKPGIFRQEDNGIITGTTKGENSNTGLDFGAGKVDDNYHEIVDEITPLATHSIENIQTSPDFDHSLARFILDPSIKGRPTPVNKASYLLISAGLDSIYGTQDDIINWERRDKQ